MGFQSSFNQALGIFASASLGRKYVKGQKESIAEQKMQGKFNVEREIERDQERVQEQKEVANYNLQHGTAYTDKNEMMAARAGEALASETTSKKHHYVMITEPGQKRWIKQYMEWYGVGVGEAAKAYDDNVMRKTAPTGRTVEKVLSADLDELLDEEKYRYQGGNK